MGIEDFPRRWEEFSCTDLAASVPESLLERGREYLRRGLVTARLYGGEILAASVLGSAGWYTVRAELRHGQIAADCTCPYQGDLCKHAVALLLAWLTERETFLDLDRTPLFTEGDVERLRRLCRALALAAPQEAMALLTGGAAAEEKKGTAAALAGSFRLGPYALRDPAALAERLAWVGERLSSAVAAGDPEAAVAACELAERLLAAWAEASFPERLLPPLADYLQHLAAVKPPAGPEGLTLRSRLLGLFRRETLPFFGELGLLFLSWCGGPPRPEELTGTAAEVVALLAGPGPETAKSVGFESLLLVLEAYRRWGRPEAAVALAKAGLRRPEEAERYVLRERLAAYHLEKGERRQALAYLLANFRLRPAEEGWKALRRMAMAAGEWPRIKGEVWPLVVRGDLALRIAAALDEKDPELLRRVGEELGADDPRAVAVWTALAALAPEEALDRLLAAARWHLAHGGYRSRRSAAAFLRAAEKVCRAAGWEERWEAIRTSLREEFGPLVRWPELGALLAGRGGDRLF
ncbi:MAG: SWIM zinc finger family protein [Bacillota bacterium]